MGNCFLHSPFTQEQLNSLEKYKSSDGYYNIEYKFSDIYKLEPYIQNMNTYYTVSIVFSKYEFTNTYLHKVTNFNNKVYYDIVKSNECNSNFKVIPIHISGFYFNTSYNITYPTIDFVKNVNDPILTCIYDKLLFKN